ncbi:MAG TPA: 23S rRNA (pseudouridine(1915)-N(3))-methyltransferase RlmH [Thermoanaerobaculia bacterium]
MKLRLVWVRSKSDAEYREAIERYRQRIRHFFPIEVVEIPPEKGRQTKPDTAILHAESDRLLASIPPRGRVVVLDEQGEMVSSLRFATWLERITVNDPYGVTFVLGGDLGLDAAVKARADKLLALSPMTLPHQLARVVLLEQIYRACTLMRNVPYHK